jgi:hypothetical protein
MDEYLHDELALLIQAWDERYEIDLAREEREDLIRRILLSPTPFTAGGG